MARAHRDDDLCLAYQPLLADPVCRPGAVSRDRVPPRCRLSRALRVTAPAAGRFRKAVEHWERALALDSNQYIWRRRIQQYGPRLDKPYPFYDWIPEARADIEARGQSPVTLAVEPAGAEFAGL